MKEEIKDELNEIGSRLGSEQRRPPFAVPEGYFSQLGNKVAAAALAATEANALPAPVHPYTVPGNYFAELPGRVTARVAPAKKKGLLITFRHVRWAAAAMLIIMIGAGSYQMMNDHVETATGTALLATVEDSEIQEYLGYAYHDIPKAEAVDKIDIAADDIVDYLDETGWDGEF